MNFNFEVKSKFEDGITREVKDLANSLIDDANPRERAVKVIGSSE